MQMDEGIQTSTTRDAIAPDSATTDSPALQTWKQPQVTQLRIDRLTTSGGASSCDNGSLSVSS